MSYKLCLNKAGANVIEYKKFGDWHGTWLAFVYFQGKKGIVRGAYGSCSHCDAYEREFNSTYQPHGDRNGKYYDSNNEEVTKEVYEEEKLKYHQKEIDFIQSYLNDIMDLDYFKKRYQMLQNKEQDCFDEEEYQIVTWVLNLNWD